MIDLVNQSWSVVSVLSVEVEIKFIVKKKQWKKREQKDRRRRKRERQ
jgi:hypothetical protein